MNTLREVCGFLVFAAAFLIGCAVFFSMLAIAMREIEPHFVRWAAKFGRRRFLRLCSAACWTVGIGTGFALIGSPNKLLFFTGSVVLIGVGIVGGSLFHMASYEKPSR